MRTPRRSRWTRVRGALTPAEWRRAAVLAAVAARRDWTYVNPAYQIPNTIPNAPSAGITSRR